VKDAFQTALALLDDSSQERYMAINKSTNRLLSNRPLLTDLLILLSLTPKPPLLPRNPDQKDNARQRNREGEEVPPFIRDLELLIASIVNLEVEECHTKYSLSRCVSNGWAQL
jgi:hypothetical protein